MKRTIRPKASEYQHARDEAQKRFLRIPADQKVTLYSLFFSDARSFDPWGESEVCKLRDFVNGLSPYVPDFGKAGPLALIALYCTFFGIGSLDQTRLSEDLR